jgi:GntR family histidine utilization transcriptional repressor
MMNRIDRQAESTPRYQRLKAYLSNQIEAGGLKPGDRLPSEQELVRLFSVSRMTANRAFNELEAEGAITRVQGLGSFVAIHKTQSAVLEIRDIAAEIRARGQAYRCEPVRIERPRTEAMNRLLGLAPSSEHYRSCLVHYAEDLPIQIEDRFVNPKFAPGYIDQDFTQGTPYQYLMSLASLQAAEHVFEAHLPSPEAAKWLRIAPISPCLVLRRRTWSLNMVASVAILTAPNSRYRYAGVFGTVPVAIERLPPL